MNLTTSRLTSTLFFLMVLRATNFCWCQPVVKYDWTGAGGREFENSGSSGARNNAVLTNNGADPSISGTGTATVFNGSGPNADDGFINLGNVVEFIGADYFEVQWKNLDLNVSGAAHHVDHVLGGALAPGFDTGSQVQFFANSCSMGGFCDVIVTLWEAGGGFLGNPPPDVYQQVEFNDILPEAPGDLRIVFDGNGMKQAEGGSGTVEVFVNGTQAGITQYISLGVIGPDESGSNFGLGKYHDSSSLAGDYTTGEFSIGFTRPAPSPDSTWISDSGGNWHSSSNWDESVPVTRNQTATFGDAIENSATVFLDTPVTVNSIWFDSSNAYSIAGTGSLSLDSTTAPPVDLPSISVATAPQGSHQFQAVVDLLADTTATIALGVTLEFVNRLNLNNHILTKEGGGTLSISNTFNTGSGTIISLAGVIDGSGSVGGDLINDGGTISPGSASGSVSVVPEPSCLLLVGFGVVGLAAPLRRNLTYYKRFLEPI